MDTCNLPHENGEEPIDYLLSLLKQPLDPIFTPLTARLAPLDLHLVSGVSQVLRSDDACWKYSLLFGLVPMLSVKVKAQLQPELEAITKMPTPAEMEEEVDLLAQRLLAEIASG